MDLNRLMDQAQEYTAAYARQYDVTDPDALLAIFIAHLAYLINEGRSS